MGKPREDGLPHPYTVEQEYLAAILDELRGLRADLSPREVILEEVPAEQPELMHVTEPQTDAPVDDSAGHAVTEAEASAAARVLGSSDEVASAAGRTLAEHQHQDAAAKKPAAKRPAKPRAKRSSK